MCIIWRGAFGEVAGEVEKHLSKIFDHLSKTSDLDRIILGLISVEVCPPKCFLTSMKSCFVRPLGIIVTNRLVQNNKEFWLIWDFLFRELREANKSDPRLRSSQSVFSRVCTVQERHLISKSFSRLNWILALWEHNYSQSVWAWSKWICETGPMKKCYVWQWPSGLYRKKGSRFRRLGCFGPSLSLEAETHLFTCIYQVQYSIYKVQYSNHQVQVH